MIQDFTTFGCSGRRSYHGKYCSVGTRGPLESDTAGDRPEGAVVLKLSLRGSGGREDPPVRERGLDPDRRTS